MPPGYLAFMTRNTLRILYNGACPICSREVGLYARQAARSGADIVFDDLNRVDLTPWGVTPDQARRRLHALDGTTRLDGVAAFRALWARLPGWRVLARAVGLPGVRQVTEMVYDRIAAPWLYRRSCRAQTCRVA
jgi:predicted DCC family thiol-disulfide oxidoreductase YuxK